MSFRWQSLVSVFAAVLLVLAVGWVCLTTWQELRKIHQSLASSRADDFYLPAQMESVVRQLNDIVLRVNLRRDRTDRAAFEKISRDLQQSIAAGQDKLTTATQRELLAQIGSAFSAYLSQSEQLMSEQGQGKAAASAKPVLLQTENNAAPLLELCEKLKESERAEQIQLMNDSQRALAWIQELLITISVVLIILIGAGIVTVYTGVIGPLRVELSKSRAVAMRNEKLASLGTLAAGVAHEIRNPLTAINVRLHSLKRSLAQNSSEIEDALVIGNEIQRLERIVQEFLQFARPSEPKFTIISADSLLAKVRALFESQLAKASIQLKLESLPDIWVRADPNQMEQVLINLIKNATESIQRNGTITLRVRTCAGRTCPMVGLEVSDTGKGISEEVQKRMFDPFFTTKEEGTGLGLVIASRIIEKHNGRIECHSELNRGTTFVILLPQINPHEIHETPA